MNSRSDNFNRYIITAGIVAAILLSGASFILHYNYRQKFYNIASNKADEFSHTYLHTVFGNDSLRIARFRGRFVVMAFFSDAMGPSIALLHDLAGLRRQYGDQLEIVAASVRTDSSRINAFNVKTRYPFHYVFGDKISRDMSVPGLPCFIVFDPNDSVVYVHAGYRNQSALDPIRKILSNR